MGDESMRCSGKTLLPRIGVVEKFHFLPAHIFILSIETPPFGFK